MQRGKDPSTGTAPQGGRPHARVRVLSTQTPRAAPRPLFGWLTECVVCNVTLTEKPGHRTTGHGSLGDSPAAHPPPAQTSVQDNRMVTPSMERDQLCRPATHVAYVDGPVVGLHRLPEDPREGAACGEKAPDMRWLPHLHCSLAAPVGRPPPACPGLKQAQCLGLCPRTRVGHQGPLGSYPQFWGSAAAWLQLPLPPWPQLVCWAALAPSEPAPWSIASA